MKEAFDLIKERLEEVKECDVCKGTRCVDCDNRYKYKDCDTKQQYLMADRCMEIVSEVEAEYTKNIMDELLEAKKNCGEDSDCSQCVFGCEDGCRLQELQITGGNNGWIPCSERLPDIGERVLLWVYGREHIGKRINAKLFEYDIFSLESGANESTKRIEAWKPLSEPYKPET